MAVKDRKRRRLARLGVIRLGLQVENQSGRGTHPVQTDYFVLKDAPDIQAFYDEKGVEKVRELDVLLPFPDIERNFSAFYQVWAGGVLVCQGDGEFVQYATPLRAEIKQHKKGDQIVEMTHVYNAPGDTLVTNGEAQVAFEWNGHAFKPGDTVECSGQSHDLYPHCAACKLSALLKVMMADPDLFRMGYYQIGTGSKRNHDTIMGTLELFPADRVNAIPFKLRLVEEQITFTENGQRKKGTKWFLQLEPDPKTTRRLYGRKLQEMLGEVAQPSRPALSSGPDWDEIDPELRPPYVEAGIDAANGYDDDEPLEGTVEEPPPEMPPFPEDAHLTVRDSSFFEAAVKEMDYENIGKVKEALLNIMGNSRREDSAMPAYWQWLWDYKTAPAQEVLL